MKKPQVLFLIGPPASGKTTWALEKIASDPKWVRVSRDSFRDMFKGSRDYDESVEKLIKSVHVKCILRALIAGKSVVIDDTNLKISGINSIKEEVLYYADVDYKTFVLDRDTLIERDSQREHSVGEKVIDNFLCYQDSIEDYLKTIPQKAQSFRPRPMQEDFLLPEAVIVDIDGTLAHNDHRSFFDVTQVDKDKLNPRAVELTRFYKSSGKTVFILTGREGTEVCKELTYGWLNSNDIPFDEVFFRKEGDYRKDSIIKREIYEGHISPYYSVIAVLDDRLQVLKMWHKLGLYTVNLNQGNYEF